MRKNNLETKRIRAVILFIMMLTVIIGVYINIRNTKATELIKITAKVTDIEEKVEGMEKSSIGGIRYKEYEEIEETKQRGKEFRGIAVCRACNGTGKDENSWTNCTERIRTSNVYKYCPECNNNTLTIITYNCEICGAAGVGGGCPCGLRIGNLNIFHNPIHPDCAVCGGTGEVNCDIWIDVISNYEGWSQSKTVTITANSITGFDVGSEFKYALSSSGTVAPSSWEEPYTNGKTFTIDKSTITRLTGNTTGTGIFYVWVKSLTDPYGFTTGDVVSLALKFDNTAPVLKFSPNGNTTYAQSQSTTVTVTDEGEGTLGALKYVWTESETEPTENEWRYSDEFSNGDTITISKGTGVRYLWVSAKDSVGNETITRSNAFYLDNTEPIISISCSDANICTRTKNVIITVTDTGGSELSLLNSYQYYLSTTNNTQAGGEWISYKNAFQTTIGSRLTGTYFLWIRAVNDNAGNTSNSGNPICYINRLQFDNTAPTAVFSPNGNTKYAQSQSTTVTVTDVGEGTLGALKYVWTESETEPTENEWRYSDEFSNGDTINISKGTGVRYLWISVEDSLGNNLTTHSNAFYLDNTAPTITEVIKSATTLADEGIILTVIASDSHSGIATTKGYSFDGGETWQNENTKTYNENTKNIQIKVKDNVGNITEYGEIINIDEIETVELKAIEISTIPNKTEYIEGEDFDTTGMVVTAIYEDKTSNEVTNYIVVDGENLSLEQTSVTIRYTENGVTKEILQKITVYKDNQIDIEEYEVKEDEDVNYIRGVEANTTISEIQEKIQTRGQVEIYKDNKKIEDENTKLGTGMEVIISFTNGESTIYKVVVAGDINGDGDVKASDLSRLKNALIGRNELAGAYKEAADTNGDGNLKASDLSKLKRMIVGV